MREPLRDPQRLKDILQAIESIENYTRNETFESIIVDPMRYHAVVYNIMIIGEAANMITHEFRDAHTDIPWKQIVGIRNFLIHGYFQVEKQQVWKVVETDLPQLKQHITKYVNTDVR